VKFKKQKPPTRRSPLSDNTGRSAAFSYYSRSSASSAPAAYTDRKPGRDDAKPRRFTLAYAAQRFGAVVALIALILLLVSSIQVTMMPKVQILNQADTVSLHSVEDYQAALEQIMKRSWTNTNKITINTREIGRQLQAEHPEVADISIELPLIGQRPIVYLQLTEPQLLLTNASGQAFVIDEDGRALVDASQVSEAIVGKLPTVIDESSLQITPGSIALSAADVRFITSVLYQLDKADVAVGKLVLPQGSRQLTVHLYKQDYYGKFNLQAGHPNQQVGTFLAVRDRLKGEGKQPKQYIDVRLLGRAYYK